METWLKIQQTKWSDDISHSFCFAGSICKGRNQEILAQMECYIHGYKNGLKEQLAVCIDILDSIHSCVVKFEKSGYTFQLAMEMTDQITNWFEWISTSWLAAVFPGLWNVCVLNNIDQFPSASKYGERLTCDDAFTELSTVLMECFSVIGCELECEKILTSQLAVYLLWWKSSLNTAMFDSF